ncbi:MAG: hypothetical protein NZM37_00395 [Sandaracinaceae bacterium]|nr:hypothetical protein [Sandaracinaceae bacterium]MDW8245252.1 hypothetical protein [Sandaracinaceae bacterium]
MGEEQKGSREETLKLLRELSHALVQRMAKDPMIGFYFAHTDLERLARLEFQHLARLFGFDIPYEGRPLEEVHYPRRIFEGHFHRRLVLLKEVLEELGAPSEIRKHWLEMSLKEKDRIVHPHKGACA